MTYDYDKKGNSLFPVKAWKEEVAADDTRLGYIEWVEHQMEALEDEQENFKG